MGPNQIGCIIAAISKSPNKKQSDGPHKSFSPGTPSGTKVNRVRKRNQAGWITQSSWGPCTGNMQRGKITNPCNVKVPHLGRNPKCEMTLAVCGSPVKSNKNGLNKYCPHMVPKWQGRKRAASPLPCRGPQVGRVQMGYISPSVGVPRAGGLKRITQIFNAVVASPSREESNGVHDPSWDPQAGKNRRIKWASSPSPSRSTKVGWSHRGYITFAIRESPNGEKSNVLHNPCHLGSPTEDESNALHQTFRFGVPKWGTSKMGYFIPPVWAHQRARKRNVLHHP